MARRVAVRDPTFVRGLIADAFLGQTHNVHAVLGAVRLQPHQREAVARIDVALQEYGGALLADSVGLGKTFVALAVARRFRTVLVIAPAVLCSMWKESARRTGRGIDVLSMEALGRGASPLRGCDLVIVDEAHHFRSPRTARYQELARHASRAHVLLLTATPVHNRSEDLDALLALFLGDAATTLSAVDRARCIVRREHDDVPGLRIPRLPRVKRIPVPGRSGMLESILSLPPPFPPRDGAAARTLVSLGLAHLWTSSDAAFNAAIKRRLASGAAIRDSLVIGRVPSRCELRAWTAVDGAVQLAFADVLIQPGATADDCMLEQLERHLAALREVSRAVRAGIDRDAYRAQLLRKIRATGQGTRILAFSSYAETVHALYKRLCADGRVAALTGRSGLIASGRLSRERVISMFRAPRHERERIDLLVTTDLLSEGLNLPEAAVVVHLDLPWTAARLEQRVGRACRPGSAADAVNTYAFVQPPSIEQRLRRELLLSRKASLAAAAVGELATERDAATLAPSPPRAMQALHRTLTRWLPSRSPLDQSPEDQTIYVAAVHSDSRGFIALLTAGSNATLICASTGVAPGTHASVSDNPNALEVWACRAEGDPMPVRAEMFRQARRSIASWVREQSACAMLAANAIATPERRRILQRTDRIVAQAPAHARRSAAQRATSIRAALARRLPRGLETELERLHHGCGDDAAFIEQLARVLENPDSKAPADRTHPRVPADYRLSAVLLFDA